MSLRQYQFCPACKAPLARDATAARCRACEFVHYDNPAPCAGIVPIQNGKALIAIRGIEPFKGAADAIGGFMQAGETPERAALRELLEETGLAAEINGFIGSYTDTYGADGVPTLALYYTARITGGTMAAQDDVAELRWVPIADLPEDEGFAHIQQLFRDLKEWWKRLPEEERQRFA
ncbi:NUDIX hydrolase [Candidatus Berkelbacteria bacterium]|nr:NUDIX hydrolase [Candidatus Berkelbacteria bacterium]